jgi:hypothetical protein
VRPLPRYTLTPAERVSAVRTISTRLVSGGAFHFRLARLLPAFTVRLTSAGGVPSYLNRTRSEPLWLPALSRQKPGTDA